jgi:sulfonate transport system substrate-binding protein
MGRKVAGALRFARTLAGVAVAIGLAACGPKAGNASGGETLHAADQFKRLAVVMESAGQDKPSDYALTWGNFVGGPAIIAAETGGSIDIGWMADTPLIFSQAAGSPVKVIAAGRPANAKTSSQALVVAPNSPIRSVRDLKGKKVFYLPGTITQYFLLQLLEREGLSLDDIQTVNAAGSPGSGPALLQSGRVDVAVLPDPMLAVAESAGTVRVLATMSDVRPSMLYLVVPTKVINDPKLRPRIADFVTRVARSYQWQIDQFDAAAPVIAKFYGVSTEHGRTILSRSLIRFEPIDNDVIAEQQVEADAFYRIGLIKTKLNAAEVFDTSFNGIVSEALQEKKVSQ